MKVVRSLMIVGLVLAVASPLLAQEEQQPRRQRGQQQGGRFGAQDPLQLPRSINLTEDQQAKLAELREKYAEKLTALREKTTLSEEQRAARTQAFRDARERGLQGEELREALRSAGNLTADQQKAMEEMRTLVQEIRDAVNGILTEEQRQQLQRGQRGQRQPGERRQRPDSV